MATEAVTADDQQVESRAPKQKGLSDRARQERKTAWMLCAPAVIVMLLVTGYPIVYAIILSLQRYDLRFPDDREFVGLSNYWEVLSSSVFRTDLFNTLFITVASVSIELVLGMMIALVMHRAIFARGAVRTAVLIPYGIVTVVAAFGFLYAWSTTSGFIPGLFHLQTDPFSSRWESFLVIILTEVWKTTPFMALLLLAGLALVPDELLEAAKVDGASAWQRFWRITVPLIKPSILVALLFRTLDAFRIFDNIYVLTSGANKTASVSIVAYDNLIRGLNLGIGSTMAVLIFLTTAIIAFIFVKLFGAAAPGQE
jgi:multiple sugar transport system permease protein